jgi:outer membrane protein TolC
VLGVLAGGPAAAEAHALLEDALSTLVEQALDHNAELAGGAAAVEERLARLDAARARYRPSLDFVARYSVADGGRSIDLPIGDLMNPVYGSLEQLTGTAYPRVENQRIDFLRSPDQETKFVLTQALHDPRIRPGIDASRGAHRSAAAGLDALRARIVRDVRQAYYQWLGAREQLDIVESALELARDNRRVNESLYSNGKVTRDLVLRAEADALALEQQRRAAESGVTLAASYVNLLCNRPFDAALPDAAMDAGSVQRARNALEHRYGGDFTMESLTNVAFANRPELRQLDAALEASAAELRLANAAHKPSVGLAVEAGVQGEDYAFGSDDRYVLASVVVNFNAFDGGGNRARVREAHAGTAGLRAQRAQAELAIRLDVQTALERLEVADAALATAERRVAAAEAAFDIASRKRDLGQINATEYLDARNAVTAARSNWSLGRADALARLADVEYATGLHP